MVSNLARLWDEDIKEAAAKAAELARIEALQEGGQRERIKIIRSLSTAGLPLDLIAKTTETPLNEVKKILQMPS